MVTQGTPDAGRPVAPWEGALARLRAGREDDLIVLWEVFRMNEWEAGQVNLWFRAMQAPTIGRHEPGRQIHPAVCTWYADPESLPVVGTIPSDIPIKTLL